MEKKIEDYLHLYLGCEMRILDKATDKWSEWKKLTPQVLDRFYCSELSNFNVNLYFQLALRSLSDIKVHEAREYAMLYMKRMKVGVPISISIVNNKDVKITVGTENHAAIMWPLGQYGQKPESLRYLLSKHFDLFGLIESGLAIDKAKLQQLNK